MTFLDKINLFCNPVRLYPYDEKVDKIVNTFIDHGVVNLDESDTYRICIEYNHTYYYIWACNRFFGDLSDVVINLNYNTLDWEYLYDKALPSRKTKYRFWKWIETEYSDFFKKEERNRKKYINTEKFENFK